MPNAETTFADRLGRASIMKETVEDFVPPFNPSDASLGPANFQITLDAISVKNTSVGNLRDTYTVGAGERVSMVKDLKDRSKRVKNFVISDKALKSFHTAVKRRVASITHIRTKKSSIPADPNSPVSLAKRNKGELSYADIAGNFDKLLSLLNDIGAGYTPASSDLTIANLTTSRNDFVQKNKDLGEIYGHVAVAVKERKDLYDDDGGLRDKMKAIKAAVSSQYGADSAQFNAVKGINL